MVYRALITGLLASAFIGCGARPSAPTDAPVDDAEVIGGRPADSDRVLGAQTSASTVALIGLFEGHYHSYCSGTLIAGDLVLTAAHCLTEDPPEEMYAYLGSRLPDLETLDESDADLYKIDGSVVNPTFDPSRSRLNDIALLKLTRIVEGGARPAPIIKGPLVKGTDVVIAGYGLTRDQAPRQFATGLNLVEMPLKSADSELFTTDQSGGQGACGGDSGGPAFVEENGQLAVAGAVRGSSPDSHDCEHVGELTPLSSYQDFIGTGAATLRAEAPTFVDAAPGPVQ